MYPTSEEHFMRIAIREAEKSKERVPCGAVIVKGNNVVAKASNKNKSLLPDPTAHAEISAIQKACRKLKTKDLSDCELYCTCEPCLMCLTAIIFADIQQVVFAVPLREAAKNYVIQLTSNELLKKTSTNLSLKGGFLKEEAIRKLYAK